MAQSKQLDAIIAEMNVWKDVANIEEQYKVRQLDAAIRALRRKTVFPWNIRKTTLRVFANVLEYPVAADHDEILYLDDSSNSHKFYSEALDFKNTSLQQFYEDYDSYRNSMTEIWKDGTKMIGVNLKSMGLASTKLDGASDVDNYTVSDDATSVVKDTVIFKEDNSSMRVTVVNSADLATIKCTFVSTNSDMNYQRKYHFRWIYLGAVPTSIEMQLQTSDSAYLSTVVTAQFSGEAFKANDWNLIAQDLSAATETGTFDENTIASDKLILNGAASGTYYVDAGYMREWQLLDYWYYSFYTVIASGGTTASKEYFIASDGTYDVTDSLIGDSEWLGVIMYDAMDMLLADIENEQVLITIRSRKKQAWADFDEKYPNMVPLITTGRTRFNNDPGQILQ